MKSLAVLSVSGLMLLFGCTSHTITTKSEVEVKPMHITIDVNIKVDKALDDFFGDLDESEQKGQN